MIKGINKSIIEINNTQNEYIEKAIFIINPKATKGVEKTIQIEDYFNNMLAKNGTEPLSLIGKEKKKNKYILPLFSSAIASIVTAILFSI